MQQEVLASEAVAPVTTKLECAKLADGAACLLLVPAESQHTSNNSRGRCFKVTVESGVKQLMWHLCAACAASLLLVPAGVQHASQQQR
jgi:hypothetical protein